MTTQPFDPMCAEQEAIDRLISELSLTLPEVEPTDDDADWYPEELEVGLSVQATPCGSGCQAIC